MKKIEFVLTMPRRGSWNNGWSGSDKHYSITKNLTEKKYKEIFGESIKRDWYHDWGDGWEAHVCAHLVKEGERLKKSDGFCGYKWMVGNILRHGRIKDSAEVKG